MRSPGQHRGGTRRPSAATNRLLTTWAVASLSLSTVLVSGGVAAQEQPSRVTENADGQTPTGTNRPTPTAAAKGESGFAISPDGRARLHLQLDTAVGFDTNPYSAPFDREGFAGDVVARIRPGLTLNYPGSLINFDGGAFVDYGFLPGVIDPKTRAFLLFKSGAEADLEINRGGMFSFAIGDSFSFNSDPGQLFVGTFYTRLNNALRAGVGFRPGGGTLAFKLDYTFNFEKYFSLFQQVDIVDQGVFDNMGHFVRLRADYRFLPRTGVFGELRAGVHLYPFDTTGTQPISVPVNATIGVMGQISRSLTGMASLGYTNPLTFDSAGNISTLTIIGVTAQAELQWRITPSLETALGAQRRIRPAPLYQYSIDNRAYLRAKQNIGQLFTFQGALGYNLMQFGVEQSFANGQPLSNQANGTRLDGVLDATISANYHIFSWLSVGAQNRLLWRLSNASDVETGDNYSFLRNETLAILSLRY